MADPKDDIAAGTAPAIAPQESAPLPAPAPAAASSEVEAPAVAPIVAPPAAPAEAKPELSTDKPSLLESFDKDKKPAEAKPAAEAVEAPKVEAAKPAEPKLGEEIKPAAEVKPEPAPPVEYTLTVPETIKGDDPRMADFTAALREANLPAELGSTIGTKLLAMHADTMQAYADLVAAQQHKVFNDTRKTWNDQVLADPIIGGSGHVTAMTAIARTRDTLVSDAAPGTPQYDADFKAHEDFMRITGAGDHPIYLKMLHRAARYVDEPQARDIPAGIMPTPTNGANPNASRASKLYTHPTSVKPS